MKPLDTFFCWQHIITRVAADLSLQSLLEGEGVVHLSLSFSSIRWEPFMVIKRTADHQKAGWAWAVGTKTGNFILFGLCDRDCKLASVLSSHLFKHHKDVNSSRSFVHTSKSLGNEANGHDGEGRGGEGKEGKGGRSSAKVSVYRCWEQKTEVLWATNSDKANAFANI